MNHPYQLLIFDYDGTICKTDETILFTFGRTFEHYKVATPSEEKIRAGISSGANLYEMLPFVYPDLKDSPKELEEWVHTYRNIYSTEAEGITTLYDGAHDTLMWIKEQQLPCVVISNKGQQAIEESLHRFDLYNDFILVIGDNAQRPLPKKPDPAAYLQVIQPRFAHIPSTQVLMIGDTDPDLGFANNAGLSSCWASYGFGNKEACLAAQPKHTISSFAELKTIVAPGQ